MKTVEIKRKFLNEPKGESQKSIFERKCRTSSINFRFICLLIFLKGAVDFSRSF